MALQAIWVPGCVAIPQFVGTRGHLNPVNGGLVKAKFDQSVVPATGPAVGTEIDWSEIVGHSGPGGASFRGQAYKAMIFTFPIPSPVYKRPGTSLPPDPNRARLNRIFLLVSAQSGVSLNQLWVFDAGRRLFTQTLSISNGAALDDRIVDTGNPETSNTWRTGDPEVRFGVSIAVFVQFGGDEARNQIIFRSAGADFLV